MDWSLEEVLRAVEGQKCEEWEGPSRFSSIFTDTREVTPGGLFVPLAGERFDGHQFVQRAIESGAGAALWALPRIPEEFPASIRRRLIRVCSGLGAYQALGYANLRRLKLPVVAITGSIGKTTTKDLVNWLLGAKFNVHCTRLNFNNEVGVPKTLLELNEKHDLAVVELGMRGMGQIRALASGLRPRVGVITTIGESHLEILGTRENIARAKAELLECMSQESLAILPYDSQFFSLLRSRQSGRLTTFSLDSDGCGGASVTCAAGKRADSSLDKRRVEAASPASRECDECGCECEKSATGADCGLTPDWTVRHLGGYHCVEGKAEPGKTSRPLRFVREVEVAYRDQHWSLEFPLPGRHNLANLLASLAVCYEFGLTPADVNGKLVDFVLTGCRSQMEVLPNGLILIDDSYNAAPLSMRGGLEIMHTLCRSLGGERRRVAVLGDMLELGSDSEAMHRGVGKLCGEHSIDVLCTVGPLSAAMAEGARAAGVGQVLSFANNKEAWGCLESMLQPNDCVLVKASHSIALDYVAAQIRQMH